METFNFNSYVFTTKSILNKTRIINYVVHDEEGDWQFLNTEEELTEEEAALVSIDEIISIDQTVQEVLYIDINQYAIRPNSESKWIISDINTV